MYGEQKVRLGGSNCGESGKEFIQKRNMLIKKIREAAMLIFVLLEGLHKAVSIVFLLPNAATKLLILS